METTAESPGHQQHLAESVPVLAPESHFTYVATPAVTASRRGAFWLMFAVVGITLLLVAAMLVWYYTFRPSTKSHVTPASSVSTRYLTALVAYDTSTQQQLATEKSKAVFLPSWLAIVSWQQVGEMKTESIHAEVPVELHLTIAPGTDVPNQSEVTNALTAPCHLRLVLQQEGDGWYVDQNALLHSLRYALEAKNADVAFPPWDEQSE